MERNEKVRRSEGYEALLAALENDTDKLEKIYKKHGMGPLNSLTLIGEKNRKAPLHVACIKGNFNAVKYLLKIGCDIEITTEKSTSTALVCAVEKNHNAIVELLLSEGANQAVTVNSPTSGQMQLVDYVKKERPDLVPIFNKYEVFEQDLLVEYKKVKHKVHVRAVTINQLRIQLFESLNVPNESTLLFFDNSANSYVVASSFDKIKKSTRLRVNPPKNFQKEADNQEVQETDCFSSSTKERSEPHQVQPNQPTEFVYKKPTPQEMLLECGAILQQIRSIVDAETTAIIKSNSFEKQDLHDKLFNITKLMKQVIKEMKSKKYGPVLNKHEGFQRAYSDTKEVIMELVETVRKCKKLYKEYQGSKKIKETCTKLIAQFPFNPFDVFIDYPTVPDKHNNNALLDFNRMIDQKNHVPTPIPMDQLLPNQHFIPYSEITIVREIGNGAYGKVYEALWQKTQIALKVGIAMSSEMILNEIKLMTNLPLHPNIVRPIGYTIDYKKSVCVIIEFCNQGTLDQWLKKANPSIEKQIRILLDIARGVLHLHKNNIKHRDLAARNVLMHNEEAKVGDLGLSRKSQSFAGITAAGIVPVRWMPPECFQEDNLHYSYHSDTWMFGMVVYEVVTRQEPHANANMATIGWHILKQGITPEIAENTHPVLADLMKQCWALNPTDRPSIESICETLSSLFRTLKLS